MQTLEEASCLLSTDVVHIGLHKLLRMKISGSSGHDEAETAVVESLRKHLSRDGVYKWVDVLAALAKEICYWIEYCDIMLTFF